MYFHTDALFSSKIAVGDVIVGLASYGKAKYESEYNGGMGSNGLTSARHDVFYKYLVEKFPESFDVRRLLNLWLIDSLRYSQPNLPKDVIYCGAKKLTDKVDIGGGKTMDAGKLVLSPTRTYAPIVAKLLKKYRLNIF